MTRGYAAPLDVNKKPDFLNVELFARNVKAMESTRINRVRCAKAKARKNSIDAQDRILKTTKGLILHVIVLELGKTELHQLPGVLRINQPRLLTR